MRDRVQLLAKRSCGGLVVVMLGVALTACGFRLAGTADLPEDLSPLKLQVRNLDEYQVDEIKGRLTRAGARVVEQPTDTSNYLFLNFKKVPERKLVSGGSGGRNIVRLERTLDFGVKGPDGKLIAPIKTLRQRRDIELDDDRLLASNQEKENVTKDMEQALFKQLINQLRRINVGS